MLFSRHPLPLSRCCLLVVSHSFFYPPHPNRNMLTTHTHTRTKCCSDTSKVMEFSLRKGFYTPNGMQRSLVNFQPLGPLSWAKGASSRLFYGAWSCLLTKPSASGLAWENLSGTRGSHGCDVCVCAAPTWLRRRFLRTVNAGRIFVEAKKIYIRMSENQIGARA